MKIFFFSSTGCSKCHAFFDLKGDRDLGSFDEKNWTPRNDSEHKVLGFSVHDCSTAEEVKGIEKENGVRYSELFRLPYFDPVKMHVVDPMHNLFLGTYKHFSICNLFVFTRT